MDHWLLMNRWLLEEDLGIICTSLRISQSTTGYDSEIEALVEMCISDLISSGVIINMSENILDAVPISKSDPYLFSLILLYVKANFGIENTDMNWYTEQFLKKKSEIMNKQKYTAVTNV